MCAVEQPKIDWCTTHLDIVCNIMTLPALCSFLVATNDCLQGIGMQLWSLVRCCINQDHMLAILQTLLWQYAASGFIPVKTER